VVGEVGDEAGRVDAALGQRGHAGDDGGTPEVVDAVEQPGGPAAMAFDGQDDRRHRPMVDRVGPRWAPVATVVDEGVGHQGCSLLGWAGSTVAPGPAGGDHAIAWDRPGPGPSPTRSRGARADGRAHAGRMADTAIPARGDESFDLYGAYPRLSDEQLAVLEPHGTRRPVRRDEVLFREGDRHCDFFVILAGTVAVFEDYGRADERVIGVHGPRRFLGELSLLTGQVVFVTGVVADDGEVLAVPPDRLRDIVADDEQLANLILRAYLVRRSMLVDHGIGLRLVGSRFSPDTARLREFAARNRIPYRWVDLDRDDEAEALLRGLGVAPGETPVVVWHGELLLRNPTNRDLARAIGMRAIVPRGGACDLLVVGGGPAGLAAAVYGASEGLDTVVVDAVATGGQAGRSARIENYLGFPSGISGAELAERAVLQAERFGATISVPAEAAGLERHDGFHVVRLADDGAVSSRTVVVATGVRYRRLDVPRLEAFETTSVYYAATEPEAQLCRAEPVAVVGGGNSAAQAALFLAGRASCVCLIVRELELDRTMSRYLVDRIVRHGAIEVLLHSEVQEALGDRALESVVVEDNQTGQRHTVEAHALFVFIGAEPHARWLGDQIALDERGYVRTGPDAFGSGDVWSRVRPPGSLLTSRAGVLAVGDVRSGSVKRVAAAVGEGATAVRLCHEYLAEIWGY
jgi:thioredoxin reductase (NADPH)